MTNITKWIVAAAMGATLTLGSSGEAMAAHRACMMIYAPVCAVTPMGVKKTFPNACMAHKAHARILYKGRCRHR